MKKTLLFLFAFTMIHHLTAQIEQYDKDDLLECLELVLNYPDLQVAFQRDINYQNEFNIVLRERLANGRTRNIGTSPLQRLLQKIDQIDISQINRNFYLTQARARTNHNEEYWTEEDQRRGISLFFRYDQEQDIFLINCNISRAENVRKEVRYFAHFQLQENDGRWEIISDRLLVQGD